MSMLIDLLAHHISKRIDDYLSNAKYCGPCTTMEFPPQNPDPEERR